MWLTIAGAMALVIILVAWVMATRHMRMERAIMTLLGDGEEWYGCDLIAAVHWRGEKDTFYAILEGLEITGHVASRPSQYYDDPPHRRLYRRIPFIVLP
jgi:hypothetical protein